MRRQHHGDAVHRKSGLVGKVLLERGLLEQEKARVSAPIQNRFCFRLLP